MVDLSIPGYIENALHKSQHTNPTKLVNKPHNHAKATYVTKTRSSEKPDDSPKLKNYEIIELMQIVGLLIFYVLTIDSRMIVALSDITS